jgi:uncharacterized surface protein with fasciclin (FAS1) repeats
MLTLLAACGSPPVATAPTAPAPTDAPAAVAPTVVPTAIPPTEAPTQVPTQAPAPTSAPTAAPTATPLADTNPERPNDATQGRLRVSNCLVGGPPANLYINGEIAVNGGRQMTNIPNANAGNASGYLYLQPGTYSVALAKPGASLDNAFLGPLDVTVEAGHRYTVVALGEAAAPREPLLIDETAAYEAAGIPPNSARLTWVNNISGSEGVGFQWEDGGKLAAYGEYVAVAAPEIFSDLRVVVTGPGEPSVETIGAGAHAPGLEQFDCFVGSYPRWDTHTTQSVSSLTALDLLKLHNEFRATLERQGNAASRWFSSYSTFLDALERTGLDELLSTGGPFLLLIPTDTAFTNLPKEQLDALLADPAALEALLRGHIVEGYFPAGTMGPSGGGFGRTLTNLRGEQLTLSGNNEGLIVNNKLTGPTEVIFVANGTRVMPINTLLLPAAN